MPTRRDAAGQGERRRAPRAAAAARRAAGAAALHARARHAQPGYARLLARLGLLKLRFGRRLQTDGLCFICPGVKLEIGRDATLRIGRWAWIGTACKIRVHEGEVSIGAKTVIGQECTISAFQHVSIGRECIIADRVMLIDFDHGVTEVERPIRAAGHLQARRQRGPQRLDRLRRVRPARRERRRQQRRRDERRPHAGVPANAVVAGVPRALIRMREAPAPMRWE